MICPHCRKSIEEQDEYLMSARVGKDDPVLIRRQRLVVLWLAIFIVAVVVFAELAKLH